MSNLCDLVSVFAPADGDADGGESLTDPLGSVRGDSQTAEFIQNAFSELTYVGINKRKTVCQVRRSFHAKAFSQRT